MLAIQLARTVFDKKLVDSADSVIARIRNTDGKITVNLPEHAEQLLTENKDTLLYDVFSPDGTRLAGVDGLPPPPRLPTDSQTMIYRDELVNGQQFRVLTLKSKICKTGPIVVQIGETRNTRTEYRRWILLSIFIPQLILIVSALIAVWVGIGKGLKPLNRVRDAVAKRSPIDLAPIPEENAPYEVIGLITALNVLLGRVREDLVRQARFSGNAAHQLRTPIAGLKTYLQLMSKMSKDKELDQMLRQVDNGVDRITRTVQQLLSLSRAEHMGETMNTIDLNSVISEAATDVVPESIKRQVELELNVSEEPALIQGESVSLKELATNLLENAIRYNRSGGHVNVQVVNNGHVELVVDDDGIGIAPEERSQVFERFYRVSSSSNLEVEGSGLGLSIVNEIARAHGATVKIDQGSTGKGTKITITFPVIPITKPIA